jgi:hypothetical protein
MHTRALRSMVSLLALGAAGCGLLADVGDLEYGTGGASAASSSSGTTTSSSTSSSSTPTSSGNSSGPGGGEGQGGGGAAGGNGPGPTSTSGSSGGDTSVGGSGGGDGGGGGVVDPGEVCTNGRDDDDDGLVDCEDDECGGKGYACVEFLAEQGFRGHVAYAVGTPDDPPSCPSGWTEIARGGTQASGSPATCTDCSCDTPSGTCTASLSTYSDTSCVTVNGSQVVTGSGADCLDVVDLSIAGAIGVNDESATGTCPPMGGVATVPPDAEFDDPTVICEMAVGGGCAVGVCAPMPVAPFAPTRCVYRNMGGNCNAVDDLFPERITVETELADSRGCSACTCAAATGITCSATTTLYAGDGCLGGLTEVAHDGSCTVATQTFGSYRVNPTFSGGGCTPAGGLPSGGVSGSDEVTLCCQP